MKHHVKVLSLSFFISAMVYGQSIPSGTNTSPSIQPQPGQTYRTTQPSSTQVRGTESNSSNDFSRSTHQTRETQSPNYQFQYRTQHSSNIQPEHSSNIQIQQSSQQASHGHRSSVQKPGSRRATLERLLVTHGVLLYEAVVAVGNDAPKDVIEAGKRRSLENARDIADFVGNLFGEEANQRVASLLERHLQIGADYLNAVKMNDQNLAKEARTQWLSQAREIANFLSTLIPTLSNQELSAMWDEHINLEAQLITAYFQGDKKQADSIRDRSLMQLREMADLLASGGRR